MRRWLTCSSGTSPRRPPNRKYVGDITYLPLADGSNLYLATVIDCCSRKLAGWAVADHMRTELVTDALKAALAERGSLRGAIFHADHGAQYTSKDMATSATARAHPVPRQRRHERRQRPRRGVQRDPETRDPRRRRGLLRRGVMPPRDLPMGGPLQHPQTPFLPRPPSPEHLLIILGFKRFVPRCPAPSSP